MVCVGFVVVTACASNAPVEVVDGARTQTSHVTDPSAPSTTEQDDGAEPNSPNTVPAETGSVETDPGTGPTPDSSAPFELDSIGDSLYPQMGNGGYEATNYDLRLDVDVDENFLDAVASISATATQDLTSFHLDLSDLDVAGVTVDGQDAEFVHDPDELAITPVEPIDAGQAFLVEVTYSGNPQSVDDPAVPFDTIGWQNREGVVYVAAEPSGAKSWFPSNNHPTDKATFTFEITTDSELTAVANGVRTALVDNGETSTATWVMDDPMTTYLAAIYVGEFELRESTTASGLRIRNYFPPALADDLEADFKLTADVIEFYEELFGAPYPFDEYGSIVVPLSLGFALENQTISLHGIDSTDPVIVAHEILHQWIGNSVTVSSWQDIWMLEGFATYMSYMYFEDRGLDESPTPEDMYGVLENAGSDGPADVPIDELFGLSVYYRGAMALHALRTDVGDDVFGEIVRAHYERNVGEDVSTDDFLSLVEELTDADTVARLEPWLFGTELPPFPE